jgi:hypothetical protein
MNHGHDGLVMTSCQAWLTGGTLVLTFAMLLGLWALVWSQRRSGSEVTLLGVPAGEVVTSLGTLGVVGALAFSGVLDSKIVGALLGAHIGYHAAASRRQPGRQPEQPADSSR